MTHFTTPDLGGLSNALPPEVRALSVLRADGLYWFWIGPHAEYDKFLP